MKNIRACITFRPKIYNFIKQQALKEQFSISRYIEHIVEKILENEEEEDVTYSKEELYEAVQEAKEAIREVKEGKLKPYATAEEMFKALNDECDLQEKLS